MKLVFELSKGELNIAKAEVEALFGKGKLVGNLLLVDSNYDCFERLAFTKNIYELLFETTKKQLEKEIEKFNWEKHYKKSFCIRVHNEVKIKERDFAELIWQKLKNPKVNLNKPKTEIHFFFEKSKVFALKLIHSVDTVDFEKRRAHLRPAMHPSSLHPRLARAFINLTGIKKGKITDHFCGTGGILLEAKLLGFNIEGFDIDDEMLKRAKKNLKKAKIIKKDATKINKSLSYVCSDLPYGKSTKSQNLEKLYSEFFKVLKKNLKNKAVIGLPSFTQNKKLLKSAKLKIEKEFTIYLHKSLSKKIYVISA